jgi:hypothetical protein
LISDEDATVKLAPSFQAFVDGVRAGGPNSAEAIQELNDFVEQNTETVRDYFKQQGLKVPDLKEFKK